MVREQGTMSLFSHLDELRIRLTRAMLALVAGAVVSTFFARRVLQFIIEPLGDLMPTALGPTTSMVIFFKVALVGGAALAMPMIVYQLLSFIVPGLTKEERRYLWIVIPGVTISFLGGAAFAYYVMLSTAIPFLQNFLSDIIEPSWTIEKYVSLVTSLVFWVGVSFETPLVMGFLARMGIVTPRLLIKGWRYALVVIAVIAAAVTPTVDPLNMVLVMLPLIALYGLGILLAVLAYRERTRPSEDDKSGEEAGAESS